MKSIILASASPRRKELLKYITEDFTVIPSLFNEKLPAGIDIDCVAEYLAIKKAEEVYEKNKHSTVIGCDTVVIADNKILGKPSDRDEAFKMLKILSGKTHRVITGCSVISENKTISFSVQTYVTFIDLPDTDINDYINTDEPFDKAGGYGIQGKAALFVKKIDGDYYNVVGLPVSKLYEKLKNNNFI